jgi:S1-C subfamily serine protease
MPDFEDVNLVEERELTGEELFAGGAQAEKDLRVVDWATGVAVDQNHLIMSRRVAEGGLGFWVRRDGQLLREMPGKTVAVSGAFDLTLVRFGGLGAEVVPLETADSTRAMDIRIVAYPEPGILSGGALVSKGTVVDLQTIYVPLGMQYLSKRVDRTSLVQNGPVAEGASVSYLEATSVPMGVEYVAGLIHDTDVNLGGQGAPLINLNGKIVGIDSGGSNARLRSKGLRSAINHTEVRQFLQSTGMQFPDLDDHNSQVVGDIDQYVRALAEKSVFQIAVVGRVPRLSWSDRIGQVKGIRRMADWNAYEDPWCIVCSGRGEAACFERGCVKGVKRHKVTVTDGVTPQGTTITHNVWVPKKCEVCGGDGFVTCPHCHGKHIEPLIR